MSMRKIIVAASVLALAAGCPKKTGAATADAGVEAATKNPHAGLSHEDLMARAAGPQGIHDAVSKSKIATLPMSAPVVTVDDVTFTRADLERAIAQHAVVAG